MKMRHDDPLIDALAGLPPVVPGERHAAQVRARCRERLEGSARRPQTRLEPLTIGAVAAVCVAYVLAIVRTLMLSS